MDGMDHGAHDTHGMVGMAPSSSSTNTTPMGMMDGHHEMAMMHMTFFWSKNAYILFSGWPGTSTGMYALALIFVFVLCIIVEWLSRYPLIKTGPKHVTAGLLQTLLHGLKVGLGFMVMLAVMSFNVGVFLVAVAGHSVGFLLFHSRVFKDSDTGKRGDVLPSSC